MRTRLKFLAQLKSYISSDIKNQNIISFAVCLLIASSLWFLNALNKEYTIEVSYPIKYTNMPKDKMLTSPPPSSFKLQVNAGGFAILRQKTSMAFTPLVINYKTIISLMNTTEKDRINIPTKLLENKLKSQISPELHINSISPDSISFHFEPLIQKRIQIKPNITYSLAKQHFNSSKISFKPDSIDVFGPHSIIDTLHAIYTEEQHYNKLNQSIKRNINLQYIKNLQYSPQRVIMDLAIEEFTEKIINIPIEVVNCPSNLNVKIFPDRVKVRFLVSLSNYAAISSKDFKFMVDYNDTKGKDILEIKMLYSPDFIYGISNSPTHVEYLILNQ